MAFSPDGTRFVSSGIVYDTATGKELVQFKGDFRASGCRSGSARTHFSATLATLTK